MGTKSEPNVYKGFLVLIFYLFHAVMERAGFHIYAFPK